MTCSQTDAQVVQIAPIPGGVVPTMVQGAEAGFERRFIMSDNPESVNSSILSATYGSYKYATLWHDYVNNQNIVHYRLFVWHVNKTGATAKYGITIGNGSNSSSPATYQLLNFRHSVTNTLNFIGHGICTAKALVGNTLDNDPPANSTISAGAVGLLKSWDVPNDHLIGGVIEFTIRHNDLNRTDNLAFRLRSVMANSTLADLRVNQSPVVNPNSTHPRGSWAFSNIRSALNFEAGAINTWKYYNISNGGNPSMGQATDDMMTQTKSYDNLNAFASNKGHYGIRNVVTLSLKNNYATSKTVDIYLTPRVNPYGGAYRWNTGTTFGIPKIQQPSAKDSSKVDAVLVASVTIPEYSTVSHELTTSTAGSLSSPAVVAILTKN